MFRLLGLLSFLVSVYMAVIFFRIMLTWFSGFGQGGLQGTLARITDPYLNWFRRFTFLRVGVMDLSPVAALGVLSLLNRILSILAVYKTITLGIVLAMVLQILWGTVSFFLGFLIIILILRLIADLFRLNTYGPFWQIVDGISKPVIYRINRLILKDRIVKFTASVIISLAALGITYLAIKLLVDFVFKVLTRLPV